MKQLFLLLAFFILPIGIMHAQYSGGSGTAADPYKISTKADLKALSENSDDWWRSFILTNDISFEQSDFEYGGDFYNSAKGFKPIGYYKDSNDNATFYGVFDGQGHTIDELYINRSDEDYVGMFGYVGGGSNTRIENLKLSNVNITAKNYVAGLTGYSFGNILNCEVAGNVDGVSYVGILVGKQNNSTSYQGGTITNCGSKGKVTGSGSYVGGLIGAIQNNSVSISKCFSTATVNGNGEYVGGLIGYAYTNKIANCYATGNVEGVSHVGGLVGYGRDIYNCYAKGQVSGNNKIGGLVGTAYSIVKNCYATGEIFPVGGYAGGLVGYGNPEITSCYYVSGTGDNDYGTALRFNKFSDESQFKDWDFSKSWTMATVEDIESGMTFPYLNWQTQPQTNIILTFKDAVSDLVVSNVEIYTKDEEFVINRSDKNGIAEFKLATGKYTFKFTVDEYLAREFELTIPSNDEVNQEVIMTPSTKAADSYAGGDGTEDNPYQITNLSHLRLLSETQANWGSYFVQLADIDASETLYWNHKKGFSPIGINYHDNFYGKYDGLGKKITGLYVNRPSENYTGLFGSVGKYDGHPNAVINTNVIDANINGNNYTGGITGRCRFATINNCSYSGNVDGGDEYIGAITGYQGSSSVLGCKAEGNISGGDYTGGLIGYSNNTSNSSILNSSFSGLVMAIGHDYVGGLAGEAHGSIENCHTNCEVQGSNRVGALIGSNSAIIKNCSAKGSVLGNGDYVGGLVGAHWANNIRYCYVEVEVNNSSSDNSSRTGGIAGYSSKLIEDCFTTGNVSSVAGYCGGIVGDNAELINCYAAGEVNSTGKYIGRIVGRGSSVSSCYYLNNQSNSNTYGAPISKEEFTVQSNFSGWNFNTVWSMGELPDIADGVRPYLQWQYAGRKKLSLTAEDEEYNDFTSNVSFTGGGWSLPGDELNIEAKADGYDFLGWYDNRGKLISEDNPYTFTMGDNHLNMVAMFKNIFTDVSENELSRIHLYPNPASDFMNLDNLAGKYVAGSLYNISGTSINQFELGNSINQYQLNISSLHKGVYLLKLTAANGTVEVYKIYKK